MNSFAFASISRAVATTSRRTMGSTTSSTSYAAVEPAARRQSSPASSSNSNSNSNSNSFKNSWLSDISTYPIIAIMAVAIGGCASFMVYKFTSSPDVRVSSSQKGQVVRK